MTALGDIRKSETLNSATDDRSNAKKIFDEFCADRETVADLAVTAEELQELSRASLLGTLAGKDDLLFILRQIRAAMKSAASPKEQSIPDVNQLAETMRLAALAKLDELDLEAAAWRRSALGRLESACARVTMILNLARLFAMQLWYKSGGRPRFAARLKPLAIDLTVSS